MFEDWLDKLDKLYDDDKRELTQETRFENVQSDADTILRACDAHNLLRRVQGVLLRGKGSIDVSDKWNSYERAIALVWQGRVSQARRPDPRKPADCHCIVVGAKAGKLFVNDRQLSGFTPEALKAALVEAAKKPLVKRYR